MRASASSITTSNMSMTQASRRLIAATILGPMPGRPRTTPRVQAAGRRAPLPGQPLRRRPAPQPRAGNTPVPQDALSEIPRTPSSAKRSTWRMSLGLWSNEIERLLDEALEVKNQILGANVRLVVSIVKTTGAVHQELLRIGQRRQHEPDPCGREVRLFARVQVQHLRDVGDRQ